MPKTLVLGLTAHEADIDLLNDDRELERGENLMSAGRADIEAGARGIATDCLHPAWKSLAPGRHRGDFAPFGRIARLDPIIEHIAEIGERIALRAHVPGEHLLEPPCLPMPYSSTASTRPGSPLSRRQLSSR